MIRNRRVAPALLSLVGITFVGGLLLSKAITAFGPTVRNLLLSLPEWAPAAFLAVWAVGVLGFVVWASRRPH